MKKKFKHTKFAKIAGSILKGALADVVRLPIGIGAGAVVGLKEGIEEVKRSNINDENGGVDKIDWIRWAFFGASLTLIALLIFGVIDKETFEYLLEVLNDQKD